MKKKINSLNVQLLVLSITGTIIQSTKKMNEKYTNMQLPLLRY